MKIFKKLLAVSALSCLTTIQSAATPTAPVSSLITNSSASSQPANTTSALIMQAPMPVTPSAVVAATSVVPMPATPVVTPTPIIPTPVTPIATPAPVVETPKPLEMPAPAIPLVTQTPVVETQKPMEMPTPNKSSTGPISMPTSTLSEVIDTQVPATITSNNHVLKINLEELTKAQQINNNAPVLTLKVGQSYTFEGAQGSEIIPREEHLKKRSALIKSPTAIKTEPSKKNQELKVTAARESISKEDPYPILYKKTSSISDNNAITIAKIRVVKD
jgi:hypothetical protein